MLGRYTTSPRRPRRIAGDDTAVRVAELPGGTAEGWPRVGRESAAGRPRVGCPGSGHIGHLDRILGQLCVESARINRHLWRRPAASVGLAHEVGRIGTFLVDRGRTCRLCPPGGHGKPTIAVAIARVELFGQVANGPRRRPLHSPANRPKYAPDIYSTDHARRPRKRIHRPPKRHGHAAIAGNAQGDVRGRAG